MRFDSVMYNDLVGSYVIALYAYGKSINSEEIPTLSALKKRWVEYKKRMSKNDFPFDEPSIQNIEKYFRLPHIKPPVALVQSALNGVFLFYIDEQCLPIREDGILPGSYYRAEHIIPIDWDKE